MKPCCPAQLHRLSLPTIMASIFSILLLSLTSIRFLDPTIVRKQINPMSLFFLSLPSNRYTNLTNFTPPQVLINSFLHLLTKCNSPLDFLRFSHPTILFQPFSLSESALVISKRSSRTCFQTQIQTQSQARIWLMYLKRRANSRRSTCLNRKF